MCDITTLMKNNPPKVSYILCVFNGQTTVSQCIRSILSQRHVEIEIIAVNDGSTDNSLQVLKSLANRDKRIQVIDQPNLGLSMARNAGIQQATGDYIASGAQDDIYLPQKTIEQLKTMKTNQWDFCFTQIQTIDFGGKKVNHPHMKLYNKKLIPWPWGFFEMALRMPVCSPTMICKKECYQKIQWNPGLLFCSDLNLWIKFFSTFRGGKVNKILFQRRVKERISDSVFRKIYGLKFNRFEQILSVLSAILGKYINPNLIPELNKYLKILKLLMIMESGEGSKEDYLQLAKLYKKLHFTQASKKLEKIAKYSFSNRAVVVTPTWNS